MLKGAEGCSCAKGELVFLGLGVMSDDNAVTKTVVLIKTATINTASGLTVNSHNHENQTWAALEWLK